MHEAVPQTQVEETPDHQEICPDLVTSRALVEDRAILEVVMTETENLHDRITRTIRESEEQDLKLAEENAGIILWYAAMRSKPRPRGNNSQNPLTRMPVSWVRQLIREALKQRPWTPMKQLVLEFQGQEIRICHSAFDRGEFKKWYDEAIDKELEDYDKAREFMELPGFATFGGWGRIARWHEKIVEDVFRETPYVPSDELLVSLLHYYGKRGRAEVYHGFYVAALKKYANESYEHAKELIFMGNFGALGSWDLLEDRWIVEFMKEAYGQNPLNRFNSLSLSYKGKTRNAPEDIFRKRGRLNDLNRWMDEIVTEYPDDFKEEDTIGSIDRVVDLVTHKSFKQFGGWRVVKSKWRKILITKAILQSEDQSNIKNISYTHHDGRKIGLVGIRTFYHNQGAGTEFNDIVAKARTAKANMRNSEYRYVLPEEDPRSKQLLACAKHYTLEQQVMLGIRAEEGDEQAIWSLVRSAIQMMVITAKTILKGRDCGIFGELISEGTDLLWKYARLFRYERGVGFSIIIYKTLKTDLYYTYIAIKDRTTKAKAYHQRVRHRERVAATGTTDYLSSFSLEEISGATGQEVRRIMADKLMVSQMRSLDAPFGDDDARTCHETIGAENYDCEYGELRELIMGSYQGLDDKEQLIVKQLFGLEKTGSRSIESLQNLCSGINVRETAVTGITKLTVALNIGKAVADKDPVDTLGALLQEADSEVRGAMGMLDRTEALILTELSDIQFPQNQTLASIGYVLGISKERVRQILEDKIYPKMRRKLGDIGHDISKSTTASRSGAYL